MIRITRTIRVDSRQVAERLRPIYHPWFLEVECPVVDVVPVRWSGAPCWRGCGSHWRRRRRRRLRAAPWSATSWTRPARRWRARRSARPRPRRACRARRPRTLTDAYVVAGLPPGGYAVRVELTGFGPAVREGIALQTGQTLRVDVRLRVGGRSEAVTVSGAPPLLRSETSGLGQRDRPAAGRRSAAQRPQLHRAGQPGAGRRRTGATRGPAPAYQRRPPADQRIPLRRHLGAPARARPGRVLPQRRRHPGVHDREQQSAGGVRPFQRRRRQPDDEGRPERSARQRVRVRPPRGPQRPQLLRVGHRDHAAVPAPPVRRRGRRADPEGRHLLLRRLSGPAPDDRSDRDLDGADRAPAPGRVHRGDRRARARDLRSGDDVQRRRRGDAQPPSPATRFPTHGSIRLPGACSSAIRSRPVLARRTTIGASPTRASTRTRAASASITTCAAAPIGCSRG